MGTALTILRRTFLVGATATAGAVAFGVYKAYSPAANPLTANLKPDEAAPTPFVKIDSTGITLITPRGDMGQGAYSIQAHLIAEELDIDPMTVRVDPGQPATAYYNGAVMAESVPFAAFDDGTVAETFRSIAKGVAKLMSIQITGGSSTVPDMFERLLLAGAVARETLKQAAADQTNTAVSDLKTENGHVILPNGEKLSYASLAATAAKIDPVTSGITLRTPEQWRYLGKSVQRTDIIPKSTGTQKFGVDIQLDGMVYATVRANPAIGADVDTFDATEAEKRPGVLKVVPIASGIGVIANNTWRAFKAAEAVKITWKPGSYPATSAEMWTAIEKAITDDQQDSQFRNDGDVTAALKNETPVTAEYRTPYLAHAPLEPMNATVRVTDDAVDIWVGTQIPGFVRDHAAKLTGVPAENITLHVQSMGGSFGRRLEDTHVLQAIELAMAMKGTPVKMTWTREEDMTHDYPRPPHLGRCSGTVKDKKIEALDIKLASPSVASSWFGRLMTPPPGPDNLIVVGAFDQPYDIPNFRVTGYRAQELAPISSWRAPGYSSTAFIVESFLDELIAAAGADPLQERIRLCSHEPSRKVLEQLGEVANWSGPKPAPGKGRGVAFCMSFGVPVGQVVDVTETDDGIRIDKVWAVADIGRVLDPVNAEAQVFGSVIWALGHAINCQLTYTDYAPEQTNYDSFPSMRINEAPEISVTLLENSPKIRGLGEPAVPPAAPALANAIFHATKAGTRLREMPFAEKITFA